MKPPVAGTSEKWRKIELKFLLGVGKAGLERWAKAPELPEIKKYLAEIESELERRREVNS